MIKGKGPAQPARSDKTLSAAVPSFQTLLGDDEDIASHTSTRERGRNLSRLAVSKMIDPPINSLVGPLLTDLYQITMAYAYWRTGQHNKRAHFELFFRKNPFGGSYTIFAGSDEVLKFLSGFKFTAEDIEYLRNTPQLGHCEPAFFDDYLANLDCSDVVVSAMKEGSMAFPRVPLLTVTAPLGIGNLIETTLLTLVNYPSLIATNAARMVVAASGPHCPGKETGDSNAPILENRTDLARRKPKCVEFGLRRAQGPDGGFSASKYSHIGGFHGTSNVLAGKLLGIPIAGTHAHSFVQSYTSLELVQGSKVKKAKGDEMVELLPMVLAYRDQMGWNDTNEGELAAFVGYATAFPGSFLCLIDTYDTLTSGLRNFVCVCLALDDLGYVPRGIRLDSGDLSFLSLECESMFHKMADQHGRSFFNDLDIVASNDINEGVLNSLNKQGHAITMFGIGTNLVTCQSQPALGCVYKLVEVDGEPRIKLSNDIEKVLIPGKKIAYRLFGEAGWPLLDLLVGAAEPNPPTEGGRVLCRHPFVEQKRVAVVPQRVVKLHEVVFDGKNGVQEGALPSIQETRQYVTDQINLTRPDMLRQVNPGEYKVSVSDETFRFLHQLWQSETPVRELR